LFPFYQSNNTYTFEIVHNQQTETSYIVAWETLVPMIHRNYAGAMVIFMLKMKI